MGLEDERRRKEIKANALPTIFLSKWKELATGLEIQASCISKTQGFSVQHGLLLSLPPPLSFL